MRERFTGTKIALVWMSSIFLLFALFGGIASTAKAATYTIKTLVVAKDGSGNYSTVQAAVNAVPSNNTTRTVIYIKDGTYDEVVTVPSNKPFITFAGQDENKTIITYNNYSGKPMPGGGTYNTATSASVFINAPDFLAVNLTFQNTAGAVGQAVAIDVAGDRANFYHVRFLGWQDTLLAWKGRQYYNSVYIDGRTDYIFGDATAYFNQCQIQSLNGWGITAQYRQSASETTGYVFDGCNITGTPSDLLFSVARGAPTHAWSFSIPLWMQVSSPQVGQTGTILQIIRPRTLLSTIARERELIHRRESRGRINCRQYRHNSTALITS